MAWPKGKKRHIKTPGSGRKKGTSNKFSLTVKQAVTESFVNLGGVEAMTRWARGNQTEFYKIFARLIPHEIPDADLPERFTLVIRDSGEDDTN